jgi:N-dimethylarginine dimethylaminohydrolase
MGPDAIEAQWESLNFIAPPGFSGALAEYDALIEIVASTGARMDFLPAAEGAGLDSIYVRDASVGSPSGLILCRMGKPQREAEPAAQKRAFEEWGLPLRGAIEPPGLLEGGDVVWLDAETLIVGRGYRTNDEGIRQLRRLVGERVHVIVVPLPHWRGAGDVFHLMSIVSPVDRDLAVVYARLLPVPLRELLLERGMELIEVPDQEFDTMGANVLALAPRQCVMVYGNPVTRAALEKAGADVQIYEGRDISLMGGGGPTCLTRPIERE